MIQTVTAFDACFYALVDRKFLLFPDHVESKLSIFEWQSGSFVEVQSLATPSRAQACTSLLINNELYIAAGGWTPFNATTVYKWSGSSFVKFQTLESSYVSQLSSFVGGNRVYLAVASMISAVSPYSAPSNIYLWNGTRFVLIQAIATYSAQAARFFAVSGHTFLAVANQAAGDEDGFEVKSAIYRITGSQLKLHQELQTKGASDVRPFAYAGHQYLAVANSHEDDKFDIDSVVYRWQE